MTLNELLLSGDPNHRNQAFKQLYNDPKIIAKVQQWLKLNNLTSVEADEILQEGIIDLLAAIQKGAFQGRSSVATFLLSICKNKIFNTLRKKNPNVEFKETHDAEDEAITEMEAHDLLEEDNEKQKALKAVINKIDPDCNERMILHHVQNKSMKEVADEVGLANENQAKKAIYRCREKLREVILANPILKQYYIKLIKKNKNNKDDE
jgi:RNA polymerase sigma factor (sigma-70 family)